MNFGKILNYFFESYNETIINIFNLFEFWGDNDD